MTHLFNLLLHHYIVVLIVVYVLGFVYWFREYKKDKHTPPSPAACLLYGSWLAIPSGVILVCIPIWIVVGVVYLYDRYHTKMKNTKSHPGNNWQPKNPYDYSWFWRPIVITLPLKKETDA